MCRIKELKTKEETEKYFRAFQGEQSRLPAFLHDDAHYNTVSVLYIKGRKAAGLAFGVMQEDDFNFYLHYLRLGRNAQGQEEVVDFTGKLFDFVRENREARKVVMSIEQLDDSVPDYVAVLKEIPDVSVEKMVFIRQVGVDTKNFDHFRTFHWYCPDLMGRKGYEAIPLEECSKQWQEDLHEKEQRGDVPADYLSPGLWEKEWEYDAGTSYILVKKGDNVPLGWIVTQRMTEKAVKIRRFYIYDEARLLRLGPSFSTWVLEQIEKRYESLWFEVQKGNRQMEMFTNHYCRPILSFDFFKCYINISLRRKKDGMDTGKTE